MARTSDRAAHVIAVRTSKRLADKRGRMERAGTSVVGCRREENQRQTKEDGLRFGRNTVSSEEDELRRRIYDHEENEGGRRRIRRMNEDEERDLRRALEISQWEDQRRRHEEEQRQEDELQRQANFIRDEEDRRRPDEGSLSVMRGRHHEEDGGNLNQEVLNELRDMRDLINNSRRGGRVQLAEAIEEADKSPFTYEIMHTDIP
ncbi:uncharacterized protein KIAA1211 homolog [Papaver somniferum]|uniref:uncharacterized protein KIAA1211 homolog n=1 Tax=Papaver somniferum TaxID=3469 RepID=UPI000E6FF38C|nr:uncharacterized protein KIAA1211 homolog [Papaver somniferum]